MVSALALVVVLACLSSVKAALAGLVLSLVLALWAGLDVAETKRRILAVNAFVLFLWLTVPWSVPGESVFALGPLDVTREGIWLSLVVSLKCEAIVLAFLALLGRVSLPDLGYALNALRFPNRLTLLLLFTWRYVHVLESEWQTLLTAARLRGFVPQTSLRTYKTYANLLGMLLVRALDRSRRVWEAMSLRGFDGQLRTLASHRARPLDWTCLALLVLLAAGLLVFDRFALA